MFSSYEMKLFAPTLSILSNKLLLKDITYQKGSTVSTGEQCDQSIPLRREQCRAEQVPHQQVYGMIVILVAPRKVIHPIADRRLDPHLNQAASRSIVRFTRHHLRDLIIGSHSRERAASR